MPWTRPKRTPPVTTPGHTSFPSELVSALGPLTVSPQGRPGASSWVEVTQNYLVGGLNPKNMKVNWDDEVPNIWENKKCSKPPTSYDFYGISMGFKWTFVFLLLSFEWDWDLYGMCIVLEYTLMRAVFFVS